MENRAVILLSGGVDSTTAMAIAKNEGYSLYALTFHYGQRHAREVECARRAAATFGVKSHLVLDIELDKIGGSALTDKANIPKGRSWEEIAKGIPITYVPARNTIFLSYALAWAEVMEAPELFIGVNAVDYSGYPDCRPEYIAAFEKMANLALKKTLEGKMRIAVRTPLINMTKGEIIRLGMKLGVDYRNTHSCYDPFPDGKACGFCDSCLLRKKGFEEAGIPDPLGVIL